jgi:hypothetical protein
MTGNPHSQWYSHFLFWSSVNYEKKINSCSRAHCFFPRTCIICNLCRPRHYGSGASWTQKDKISWMQCQAHLLTWWTNAWRWTRDWGLVQRMLWSMSSLLHATRAFESRSCSGRDSAWILELIIFLHMDRALPDLSKFIKGNPDQIMDGMSF